MILFVMIIFVMIKKNLYVFYFNRIILAIFTLSRIGTNLEDYFITNPQVNIATIIWATFILVFVGALAGYIPAKRAAQIRPVEALNDE